MTPDEIYPGCDYKIAADIQRDKLLARGGPVSAAEFDEIWKQSVDEARIQIATLLKKSKTPSDRSPGA